MPLFAPFFVQHCNTILTAIQSCEGAPFWPTCPKHDFFGKTINIILMYLLAPLLWKTLKKFLESIPSYEDVPFSDPKWSIALTKNFWEKPVTLLSCTY